MFGVCVCVTYGFDVKMVINFGEFLSRPCVSVLAFTLSVSNRQQSPLTLIFVHVRVCLIKSMVIYYIQAIAYARSYVCVRKILFMWLFTTFLNKKVN